MSNPKTKLRRQLRQTQTKAEIKLWSALRAKKFYGKKFRRQHSIGKFIVDFYCAEYKLAIEVDGTSHENIVKQNYDFERDCWMNENGYSVLRFTNDEVYKQINWVLLAIEEKILSVTS